MKKKVALFAVCLGFAGLAKAQSPEALASSPAVQETQQVQTEIIEYPEDALTNSLNASLAKKGKALGVINSDGSIYVIGSATTARPSNMSGFINSRNIAYSIAEMTAKMNLLRMAGEQITSGRAVHLLEDIIEGDDPDAQAKATLAEKSARLADQSMDNALAAQGVSAEEISAMNESAKKATYSQKYKQTIRSLVAGMMHGCAVVRTAEGEMGNNDYQISVCVKYSPEFQSMAALMKDGGKGMPVMGKARSSREKIMSMPESDLIMRLGVWPTYNEKGQLVIYGFGQQEVKTVGSRQSAHFSRAHSMARLQAVNNIKQFVAEDVVAKEFMDNEEKLNEYADGTNAYYSRTQWEQAISAKKSTLNIATEQVRMWKGIHPTSQHNVAGYVVAWTFDNAQQANRLKQSFSNSPVQQRTGRGKSVTGKTQKGVITITGDDEDL